MKIYVDELPKSCKECLLCRSGNLKIQKNGRYVDAEQCVLGGYKYQSIDDEIDTCPLKSLAENDKQVRKEVCEKFVEQFILEYTMGNEPVEDIIYKVTNQIQGGINERNNIRR